MARGQDESARSPVQAKRERRDLLAESRFGNPHLGIWLADRHAARAEFRVVVLGFTCRGYYVVGETYCMSMSSVRFDVPG